MNEEHTLKPLQSPHFSCVFLNPKILCIIMMSKMGVLLLLVIVLSNQLMAGFATNNGEDAEGRNIVSILAIDGGGVKGIVQGVILGYLESALQKWDPNARIGEYFDVICGISTGGVIAGILAAPDPHNSHRPQYPASEIVDFYREHAPYIFTKSQSCWFPLFDCPYFDGKYLREILHQKMNETLLNQTATNVVIPSYDIKLLHPALFSSFKLDILPQLNVKLSDVCIGTSAAPILFPPYYFEHENTEFNLVDGVVTAIIPARLALSEVLRQEKYRNKEIILLSLGNGNVNKTGYDANRTWNIYDWYLKGHLIEFTSGAASIMSDYYINTTFKSLQVPPENYLRIQEYNLDPSVNRPSDGSQENMDKLQVVGQNLLKEAVKRMNVDTFLPEETGEGTNAQALDRLAKVLYEERQRRLGKLSIESE